MQKKIQRFLIKYFFLLAILVLGLFPQTYQAKQLFLYSRDQDLAEWITKDIVFNHHLRLIGQEASMQGAFIGPLFYCSLMPFYPAFKMDPIGGVVLVTLLGLLSIWSFYFVLGEVPEKRLGSISLPFCMQFLFIRFLMIGK